MSWCPTNSKRLVTGADDKNIFLWDINNISSDKILPVAQFNGHSKGVCMVDFHHSDQNCFFSVSDDGMLFK
jgi:WD40 repeat protein